MAKRIPTGQSLTEDLLPEQFLESTYHGWDIGSLGGHALRVAAFSYAIARTYGLKKGARDNLRRAAAFHDIGKLGVSPAILNKPGKLSAQERLEVRSHTTKGRDLLVAFNLPELREAADIAYSHHEHVDGTGYPEGCQGEMISLGARIVSVADVFDALTSHRSYRTAMSEVRALAIIDRGSNRQFDARVVAALLAALKRHPNLVPEIHSFTEAMPELNPSSLHTREDASPLNDYLQTWTVQQLSGNTGAAADPNLGA